jgi:hypothetical protein
MFNSGLVAVGTVQCTRVELNRDAVALLGRINDRESGSKQSTLQRQGVLSQSFRCI